MSTLTVQGPASLSGRACVLADKSVMHRALMFAALGKGPCTISPWPAGADNTSTLKLLQAMGVRAEEGEGEITVFGVGGPRGLADPIGNLDCGNSGTTMRLMAGILAARPGLVTLCGDVSLSGRPMSRLLPLELMGAKLSGRTYGAGADRADGTDAGKIYPPLSVQGAALQGAEHVLALASAQLKTALLLAGCFARGQTTVLEPGRSRDHTERMLRFRGVALEELADGRLSVQGPIEAWNNPSHVQVPPDLSSAAFILGAAAVTQSPLQVQAGINPTRSGVLDALQAMGAKIGIDQVEDWAGEPVARLTFEPGPLHGTEIAGELALRSLDELPLLAAVAATAQGRTTIRDAAELRVKESDRIAATVQMLRAVGAEAESLPDGLTVVGGPLKAGIIESLHDHRIAMSGAILALAATGATQVRGFEAALVSYPGFERVLTDLGAEVALQH